MTMFIFSFSDWEYTFWVNLVQEIKIISLSWNSYLDLFEFAEFNGGTQF